MLLKTEYLYMSTRQTYDIIKSTVHSFLPDARILLFGSRARNTFNDQSDYDLLIVTNGTLAPRIKMNWESKIRKALIQTLNAPFDVILQSNREVQEKKNLIGHIVYYAYKDAREI